MKRFFRLPSPAMVVALLALFVASTGVSYAVSSGSVTGRDIRNGTIRSKDVRNRGLTGSDIKRDSIGGNAVKESTLGLVPGAGLANGISRAAVVNQNGSLVRGKGVASTRRVGTGIYSVTFVGDIRGCTYGATLGDEGIDSPPPGEVGVSSLAASTAGVRVVTRASSGSAANRSFHLIVSC